MKSHFWTWNVVNEDSESKVKGKTVKDSAVQSARPTTEPDPTSVCWRLQGVGPLTLRTMQLIGQQNEEAASRPITVLHVETSPPMLLFSRKNRHSLFTVTVNGVFSHWTRAKLHLWPAAVRLQPPGQTREVSPVVRVCSGCGVRLTAEKLTGQPTLAGCSVPVTVRGELC